MASYTFAPDVETPEFGGGSYHETAPAEPLEYDMHQRENERLRAEERAKRAAGHLRRLTAAILETENGMNSLGLLVDLAAMAGLDRESALEMSHDAIRNHVRKGRNAAATRGTEVAA